MKRLISTLITLIMVFALLPAGAALPYNEKDAEVDLSSCDGSDAAGLAAGIAADYSGARIVELRDAEGNCAWTLEQVLALREALPDSIELRCGFELFGTYVTSDTEEIYYKRIGIHNSDLDTVRAALPLLTACKRFVLDYCGPTYEALAVLREEFPDKGIAWRVNIGGIDSLLTDETVLWSTSVTDNNSKVLRYCTALEAIDIGHDENVTNIEFVRSMPNLKVLIIAKTRVSDLSPLEDCGELEYLEIFGLEGVTDLSPLASCTKLEHLNMCTIGPCTDISPLFGLKHLKRLWMMNMYALSKKNPEQFNGVEKQLPDTVIVKKLGDGDLKGYGWKYAKKNVFAERYAELYDTFGYKGCNTPKDKPGFGANPFKDKYAAG